MKQELAAMLQRWKARLAEKQSETSDDYDFALGTENGIRLCVNELETFLEEWAL